MKALIQFFLLTLLLIFAVSKMKVNGQNLVPNNGFEEQDTCPQVGDISLAHPWNSPTAASPDLYNILCSSQNEDPRTGIGCAGIFVYDTIPEYREYIQAKLATPLLPGQSYCVSFWVKNGPFRYAVNKFGAYFYTGNIHLLDSTFLPANPQVKNPGGHILSSSTWEEISGSFEATGNEDHIMIGNFNKDNQTDTMVINDFVDIKASYYFIDDISVVNCITGVEYLSEPEINIFPTPASSNINVQVSSPVNIESLGLFTPEGQRVTGLTIVNGGLHESLLDLKKCLPGIYFLSVQTNMGVVIKKVLIVK